MKNNPYNPIAQKLYKGLVGQLSEESVVNLDALKCLAMKGDDILSGLIGAECRDALLARPRDLVSKNRRALIATVRSMVQGRQKFMTNFVFPNQEVTAGPISKGFFVVSLAYDAVILQIMSLVWPEFMTLWTNVVSLLPEQSGDQAFMDAYKTKTGSDFSQSQVTKFFA